MGAGFLDALFSTPILHGPRVSRDGRWAAWSWFHAGPSADVFAAPTDGASPPVRMTRTAQNTFVVSWAPDGRSLIVSQDEDGDERAQLFAVHLDRPETMVPLTDPRPNHYIRGGELHPSEPWLFIGANVDTASGEEIDPTWIYRLDLAGRERLCIARPLKPAPVDPRLSPDGTTLLYHRSDRHPSGSQIWVVGSGGDGDRQVLDFGAETKVRGSWTPDGRSILFLADAGTHRRLGLCDVDGGEIRWLVDDQARNVESAHAPFGTDRIVVIEVREARTRATLLDVATREESPFPETPGSLVPLAPTPAGTWVGVTSRSTQPADLVLFPPAGGAPFRSLTDLWERTGVAKSKLRPAEDFRWTSEDGLPIQGWLYRSGGRDCGTIVVVHGGPTSHTEDRFSPLVQYLVSRGFNVFEPNYRGSTGFGLKFRDAIKEDGWGGREQTDIKTGIEALIAAGVARAGAVGITGTSYGGYSTWCALVRWPPELVAAGVPICGMTDLVLDYETTRPDLRPYCEQMLGGSPAEVPERYRERSPIHAVGNVSVPVLIVQGLKDPNVTPDNVRAIRTALDAAGVPYDFLAFEDEGHGISRTANLKILYPRMADFFLAAFARRG